MIPFFIQIPEAGTEDKYYVRPIDILYIIDKITSSDVYYKAGGQEVSVNTLLKARDIERAMQDIHKLEEDEFNQMFNSGDK